jgi:hypothetical protein
MLKYNTRIIGSYILMVCVCVPSSSTVSTMLSEPRAIVSSCLFLGGVVVLFAVNASDGPILAQCVGSQATVVDWSFGSKVDGVHVPFVPCSGLLLALFQTW